MGTEFGPTLQCDPPTLGHPPLGDGLGTPIQDYILEGDQCLVFFLGGLPNNNPAAPGLIGFSNNPANPTTAGGDRKKFYDFDNARLKVFNRSAFPAFPFPSYLDAYRQSPFVYFSSGRRDNGYDLTHAIAAFNGVTPYYQAAGQYYNKSTFQLISAGAGQPIWTGRPLDSRRRGRPRRRYACAQGRRQQLPRQGIGRNEVVMRYETRNSALTPGPSPGLPGEGRIRTRSR